jgi:hypothetical protein
VTYFISLDTQFASDAPSEEEAIQEVTSNLIERLQRDTEARRREWLPEPKYSLEWVVEEEE